MVAARVHLVRHGEVDNPGAVLYERLDGFPLTERGHAMAAASAESLADEGAPVTRLLTSPLERTRQSAAPWAARFGLEAEPDVRLIEPWNRFAGRAFGLGPAILAKPWAWAHLRNPWRPSWGEPYREIAARMLAAMADAQQDTDSGDAVLVTHQLPIWIVHRAVAGAPLPHSPRSRRAALSSITSFERTASGGWHEVGYRDPAAAITTAALDRGAV